MLVALGAGAFCFGRCDRRPAPGAAAGSAVITPADLRGVQQFSLPPASGAALALCALRGRQPLGTGDRLYPCQRHRRTRAHSATDCALWRSRRTPAAGGVEHYGGWGGYHADTGTWGGVPLQQYGTAMTRAAWGSISHYAAAYHVRGTYYGWDHAAHHGGAATPARRSYHGPCRRYAAAVVSRGPYSRRRGRDACQRGTPPWRGTAATYYHYWLQRSTIPVWVRRQRNVRPGRATRWASFSRLCRPTATTDGRQQQRLITWPTASTTRRPRRSGQTGYTPSSSCPSPSPPHP